MANQVVIELGTVIKNRGTYDSSVKYYKDNVVQYQNSSYIVTSVPQAIGYLQNVVPTTPNSGWSIFAYGAADVIAKTPRVDVSQSFTDVEKKQVRANIGLGNGDIDSEPTAGSNNLVKSGGVKESIISDIGNYSEYSTVMSNVYEYNGYISANGTFYPLSASLCKYTDIIGCVTGQKFYYKGYGVNQAASVIFYKDNTAIPAEGLVLNSTTNFTEITIPEGVNKVRFTSYSTNNTIPPVFEVYASYFDKETSIKVKDLQGNVTTLQGNVSNINNALEKEINIDLSSNLLNGYFRIDGSAVGSFIETSDFRTKKLSVNVGEKYKVYSHLRGNSMAQIVFFDSSDNYVSYIQRGDSAAHTTEFIIPSGVANMAICTTSLTTSSWYLHIFQYFNIEQIQENANNALTNSESAQESATHAQESINSITKLKHPQLWNGETVGGVISTGGSMTGSAPLAVSTGLIPIKPSTFYYVSGRTNFSSIRCLKANGTTYKKVLVASTGEEPASNLYYYLPKEDGSGKQMNGQFKTPADAAYVQISLRYNSSTADYSHVILEEVGDTYNPDFVPSTDTYYDLTKEQVVKRTNIDSSVINELESDTNRISALEGNQNAPKVLLIGSSHGMNTISQLPWLFYRGGYSNVKVGNVYIGSFMIQELAQRIYNNQTLSYQEFNDNDTPGWGKNAGSKLMSQLLNMNWDIISLQRSASDDETWTLSQATSFGYVIKYISEYCKTNNLKTPRILFNSGFADANSDSGTSMTHTEAILTTSKQMKKEFGIEIVPTAMALRNARATWLNEIGAYTYHYLCYDSQHLDYGIGCWIASATLFETIMRPLGRSVAAVDGYGTQEEQYVFNTAATPTNYTEPTSKTMEIGKACVLSAMDDMDNLNTVITSKYQYKNSVTILSNWVTISGSDANTKCVQTGGNYSIEFSVWSGATLSSVIVKMNGSDITSTAYDSSNNTISISNVDGDVEIIIITTR